MLTGKTRYRTTWTGKLVLQVEVSQYDTDTDAPFGRDIVFWRDASVMDLNVVVDLNLTVRGKP